MKRNRGAMSCILNRKILARRLVHCYKGNEFQSLEGIVDILRSSYPDYSRFRLQPLTRNVKFVLQELEHDRIIRQTTVDGYSSGHQNHDSDDNEEHEMVFGKNASQRNFKKVFDAEAKLQKLENKHIHKRQRKCERSFGFRIPEISPSSDEGGDDGSLSTSSNASEGKIEKKFDLMKSMLRERYNNHGKSMSKRHEENIEVEVIDEKSKNVSLIEDNAEERGEMDFKGHSEVASKSVVGSNGGPFFKDLGGMELVIEGLIKDVIFPICQPELVQWLGVRPMTAILLHGPPGCGKTTLAHAIANETGMPFYKISSPEIVSGISGASEENIRQLFSKAYRTAPSIIFIDEIDAITSKRENLQREMDRRIVTQLMTCIDESSRLPHDALADSDPEFSNDISRHVLLIGATNRPDSIDTALRRRFSKEILLNTPDETARGKILSVLTQMLKLEGCFDFREIAKSTPGFVGSDLVTLANMAGYIAMNKIAIKRRHDLHGVNDEIGTNNWWGRHLPKEDIEKMSITMDDFREALKSSQPSLKRDGVSPIPDVKWDAVGGLEILRQEFDRFIIRRIKFSEQYEKAGVEMETGFLLYGPPGCGKTLIAKAVAHDAGASFIYIKGPELLSKYVGESEKEVRKIFTTARACSPCIVFFDEVDTLTTKRGNEGSWVVGRILTQLLTEMDERKGVFVIGATNRPDMMDDAALRPGRFGKHFYVPLPNQDERGLILQALSRKKAIHPSVDLISVGKMDACKYFSGADLAALVNEAALLSLGDVLLEGDSNGMDLLPPPMIKLSHFEQALRTLRPSVSTEQRRFYRKLSEGLGNKVKSSSPSAGSNVASAIIHLP